jgi:hypothetical protein
MAHVKDLLDNKTVEEVAHTRYTFPVPYVHYTEDETPPQCILVYPHADVGYVLQYEYDGEAFVCKFYTHLEAALIAARHVMALCCIQGDPNKISSYVKSL